MKVSLSCWKSEAEVITFLPVAKRIVKIQRLKYQHSVFYDRSNELSPLGTGCYLCYGVNED